MGLGFFGGGFFEHLGHVYQISLGDEALLGLQKNCVNVGFGKKKFQSYVCVCELSFSVNI